MPHAHGPHAPDHAHAAHAPHPHGHGHAHHEEFMAHLRAEHDAKIKQTIRIGIASIAGFVLVTGLGVSWWLRTTTAAEAARRAELDARASLRAELLPPIPTEAAAARALLQRIVAQRPEWTQGPDRAAIERQEAAVRSAITSFTNRERVDAELAVLPTLLEQAAAGSLEWRQLHDRLWAVDATLDGEVSADHHTRLVAAIERVDTAWFEALLAAGNAADPAAALTVLTTGLELGTFHHDDPHDHHDDALEQAWRQRLHTLVQHFDVAQRAVFGPEAIAALAWQPLLPGSAGADWVPSRGAPLVHTLRDGGLEVRCDGGQFGHSGVLMLVEPTWYGAALRLDLQLDRGEVVLFGRAQRQFDPRHGGGVALSTTARAGSILVTAGASVPIELLLLGDRVQARIGDREVQQQLRHDERRGGFGLLVRPDTAFTVRDLQVRRLGPEPVPFVRRGRG
jgi:hypothetical protein